jgi:hypothetical protein
MPAGFGSEWNISRGGTGLGFPLLARQLLEIDHTQYLQSLLTACVSGDGAGRSREYGCGEEVEGTRPAP